MSESISSRIPKEVVEKVGSYADRMRYNRSQAIRIILEDWAKAQSDEQPSEHRRPSEPVEGCT